MKRSLAWVLAVWLAGAAAGAGPVIYVNTKASGANNGGSWANAYRELTSALAVADPGSEIWVAMGTYLPSTAGDRTATFELPGGVAVYGGFYGNETRRQDRDWQAHAVVLSGDLAKDDDNTVDPDEPTRQDNSYHVVTASGFAAATVLDGITIRDGNANGGGFASGGGLYVTYANLTLVNCTLHRNTAADWGGAARILDCSPTFSNCQFSLNAATYGGAVADDTASPTFTACRFSENAAGDRGGATYDTSSSSPTFTDCQFTTNAAATSGGAAFVTGGSAPTFAGCIFTGNHSLDGGAMDVYQSTPTLLGCTFTDNLAAGTGGGLCNRRGWPAVTDCTFTGNQAPQGGGVYNNLGYPVLRNCTFTGNHGTTAGGGLANVSGTTALRACRLAGNQAPQGAGVRNQAGTVTLTNCVLTGHAAAAVDTAGTTTLVNCTVVDNGQAAAQLTTNGGTLTVTNGIVWGPAPALAGPVTVTWSTVAGGATGEGNRDADPRFVNPAAGDLRLTPFSPCIDAGTAAGAPADDFLGQPRDGHPDMGAYEGQGAPAGSRDWDVTAGYAAVALPFVDTGLATAADLLAWAPGAAAVYRFDPTTRAWQGYSQAGGTDFALAPGVAYVVAGTGPGTASMSGLWAIGLAPPLNVGGNLVCLPLEQQEVTTAGQLLTALDALGVWRWDAAAQRWCGVVAGFGGPDFAVAPGDPLYVAVCRPTSWPPPN